MVTLKSIPTPNIARIRLTKRTNEVKQKGTIWDFSTTEQGNMRARLSLLVGLRTSHYEEEFPISDTLAFCMGMDKYAFALAQKMLDEADVWYPSDMFCSSCPWDWDSVFQYLKGHLVQKL